MGLKQTVDLKAPANGALEDRSDAELFVLWADVMAELRRRRTVRTANNPVADYAEHLVAERLDLMLAGNSNAGYDAIAPDGTRDQVKARRVTRERPSLQLGALGNLESSGFDVLAVVLFEATFALRGIWTLPIKLVLEHAVFKPHVNAHVLHARPALLSDPHTTRIA